jgi:hypothetical protein
MLAMVSLLAALLATGPAPLAERGDHGAGTGRRSHAAGFARSVTQPVSL